MRKKAFSLSAAIAAGLASQYALAETWVPTIGGTYDWTEASNWSPATVPNAAGAVADFRIDIAGAQTVNLPGEGIRLGTMHIGDTGDTGPSVFTFSSNPIIWDNNGGGAQLNKVALAGGGNPAKDVINSPFQLDDDLTINVAGSANAFLELRGAISDGVNGSRGLTKTGTGFLDMFVANSYTGDTVLNGGRIRPLAANSIPGNLIINTGTIFQQFENNAIADTAHVTINGNGAWNTSGSADTVGSVSSTHQNANIGGGGHVTFGGLNIDTTLAGYLWQGTSFTKVGTGTTTLGGAALGHVRDNTATGTFSVFGGRIVLHKNTRVAIAGPLVVGNGIDPAEVRWHADQQLAYNFDHDTNEGTAALTTNVTLNGGTLNLNGWSEQAGTLAIIGANSVLDFGTDLGDGSFGSGNSIVQFDDSSAVEWGGSLLVLNWDGSPAGGGADQFIVGTDNTGVTGSQLSAISFVNPAGFDPGTYSAQILSSGEIVPVPEPGALSLLALGGLGLLHRRRRA